MSRKKVNVGITNTILGIKQLNLSSSIFKNCVHKVASYVFVKISNCRSIFTSTSDNFPVDSLEKFKTFASSSLF